MSVSHTWLRVVKHHLHDVVKFRILTVDRVVCLSSCSYSKTAALCTPLWTFKQIHFPHTKSGTRKRTKDKGRLVSLSRTYSFRIVSADYDTFAVLTSDWITFTFWRKFLIRVWRFLNCMSEGSFTLGTRPRIRVPFKPFKNFSFFYFLFFQIWTFHTVPGYELIKKKIVHEIT